MNTLETEYLGMTLKNPLVCSPSPLSHDIGRIREMEDAGAAAVVLHSLFEEQIDLESELLDWNISAGEESYAEALSYFPKARAYHLGPDAYLEHLREARAAVDIPVIASLNGVSSGGWTRYGKLMEEAGASALELNIFYLPTNPDLEAGAVEARYLRTVEAVARSVSIPVAVKVGPFFSAFAHFAGELAGAGAKGLVLFNRFYQPDLDIESLEVRPSLALSSPHELRLRLLWTAVLHGKIDADIAITGGVHTAPCVLKAMMAGARVAMMTSALLERGIGHLATVRSDILQWMEAREYESIAQMQGSMSQQAVRDPEAFERANYIKVLSSYAPSPRM